MNNGQPDDRVEKAQATVDRDSPCGIRGSLQRSRMVRSDTVCCEAEDYSPSAAVSS